jgi:enoyl-CoA hydratase/carnithine racemase
MTLDNPPVGAFSADLLVELQEQLHQVAEAEVNALVVRSTVTSAFGAGADLKLLDGLDAVGYANYLDSVRACVNALAALPIVTIAAIDGVALGAGLELALACTFRVAGPAARLGLPEIKLAMLPGGGGTTRLTALVGRERALELLLSGRIIDADEALRLGVVSRASAGPAEAEALAWAEAFTDTQRRAVAAIIRCVESASPYASPPGAATEDAEARQLFATEQAQHAIAAFVEERRRRGMPAGVAR